MNSSATAAVTCYCVNGRNNNYTRGTVFRDYTIVLYFRNTTTLYYSINGRRRRARGSISGDLQSPGTTAYGKTS